MPEHLFVVLTPIPALMGNVLLEMLAGWLFTNTKKAIISGFGGGFILNIILLSRLQQHHITVTTEDGIISLCTYLTLSFCFWAFLNLNMTSIRIRIVRELLASPAGLDRVKLDAHYSPQETFNRRIERLATARHISREQDRCHLQSTKFLPLVKVSNALRNIIMAPAGRD